MFNNSFSLFNAMNSSDQKWRWGLWGGGCVISTQIRWDLIDQIRNPPLELPCPTFSFSRSKLKLKNKRLELHAPTPIHREPLLINKAEAVCLSPRGEEEGETSTTNQLMREASKAAETKPKPKRNKEQEFWCYLQCRISSTFIELH